MVCSLSWSILIFRKKTKPPPWRFYRYTQVSPLETEGVLYTSGMGQLIKKVILTPKIKYIVIDCIPNKQQRSFTVAEIKRMVNLDDYKIKK